MSTVPEENEARVEQTLRSELEQIDSPTKAEAVAERVERLAADQTEAQRAEAAAQAPTPAAAAAARAVADTPEAPAVVEAAHQALGVAGAPTTPEAERGRDYLREAVLQRMGPMQALDARLFLAVNDLPHPRWLNGLMYTTSWIAT